MEEVLTRTFRSSIGKKTPVIQPKIEIPLQELPLNVEARVVRIDTSDSGRIHRLASLGILPGARLRLAQNRGAFLALLDRYQVAFDFQVASAVWVEMEPSF